MRTVTRARHVKCVAAAATMALVLAACGDAEDADDGDPAAADESETADPDADVDYAEALADMDEIELRVQSLYGPEVDLSRGFERWGEVIEEKSGGKISFEVFYAGALVALTDIEDGLDAGLVDIAIHHPIYSPSQFPLDNLVQDLGPVGEQTPVVGALQGMGAHAEFGFEDPYFGMMQDHGLEILVPFIAVQPNFHLICADSPVRSLEEAAGKRVRVSGESYAAEVEALGMSPVSLTGGEIYEGMQRGVVDCNVGGVVDARDMGLLELGDHWTMDSEVMFPGISSVHVSIGTQVWNDLPIEAQRLLWDTAWDEWLGEVLQARLSDPADAVTKAQEAGIEFHQWEDDAREALREHQEDSIESVRERAEEWVDDGDAFVDRFIELHEKWLGITVDDLGFSDEEHQTYEAFAEVNPEGDVDVVPFIERMKEEFAQYRP